MYEIGARIPRDENKEKIARYYGKTVDEIFCLTLSLIVTLKKECTVKAYGGDTMIATRRKIYTDKILDNLLDAQKNMASAEKVDARAGLSEPLYFTSAEAAG